MLASKTTTSLDIEISSEKRNEDAWNHMAVLDSLSSRITDGEFHASDNSKYAKFAVNASWAVNWFLLVAKVYCTIATSSKAVTAALADSVVDLVSQGVLSLADSYISRHSPDYPVGRSRLEALSVIACAFIMSMASVEVIQYAIVDLVGGIYGHLPYLNVEMDMYIILGVGCFLKLFLWIYCRRIGKKLKSDMIGALAEDHFNDVLSNSAALVTAAIAFNTVAWWLDPVGAILISLVIIYRWFDIMSEQVKKIVGFTAPREYIEQIETLARDHDSKLSVDCTRVYHFGARFNVEMEIVLPGTMTVMESHDIALALQHKIESLEDVERAFVHVDHLKRDGLEHKVERQLVNGAPDSVTAPLLSPGINQTEYGAFNELRSRFGHKGANSDAEQLESGL